MCKEEVGQLSEREVWRDKDGVDWWRRPAAQVSHRGAQVVEVSLQQEHAFENGQWRKAKEM